MAMDNYPISLHSPTRTAYEQAVIPIIGIFPWPVSRYAAQQWRFHARLID